MQEVGSELLSMSDSMHGGRVWLHDGKWQVSDLLRPLQWRSTDLDYQSRLSHKNKFLRSERDPLLNKTSRGRSNKSVKNEQ